MRERVVEEEVHISAYVEYSRQNRHGTQRQRHEEHVLHFVALISFAPLKLRQFARVVTSLLLIELIFKSSLFRFSFA
jgi:hypothetical protein